MTRPDHELLALLLALCLGMAALERIDRLEARVRAMEVRR